VDNLGDDVIETAAARDVIEICVDNLSDNGAELLAAPRFAAQSPPSWSRDRCSECCWWCFGGDFISGIDSDTVYSTN